MHFKSNRQHISIWLAEKIKFLRYKYETAQLTTAQKLAYLTLSCRNCLYSQWLPGEENQVAYSLSRGFHLTDFQLTQLIISSIPSQIPFGFQIHPLPEELASWLTLLLRNQQFKEQWSKQQIQSKLSLGHDRSSTYNKLESTMTGIWTTSININDTEFSAHSAMQSAIREGRLLTKQNKTNEAGSVRAAFNHVAQDYKLAERPDPRLDKDRKFAFILQRQLRG